jgi:SOS response regulatory protein OraA/RecX
VLASKSIPELIDNVVSLKPETEFPMRNLDLTRTALLTRLNPYRDNPVLQSIFYVKKSSIDFESVKDKNIIIDLHGLDMKVAYKKELRLIYNNLSIAYLRQALKTEEATIARNLFIADEAQLLVPKILQKAISTDTWTTTDFATRLRKRGESLVVISQSPANIEDDIRKNSQNMFVFRLHDPWDIKAIAGMFGCVHVDEVNYFSSMLTSLEERTALTKTPQSPFPFTIKTLDVEFPSITEEELERYLTKSEKEKEETLGEDEKELIKSIKEKPFLNNTDRALSLCWHRSRYSEVRKSLKRKGLIEEISFKTKLRGAPSRFLKPIEKNEYGRGQFIHAFWVERIFNYLKEQGLDPKKEYRIGDKIADVAYSENGELILVEVEYKSDWKGNIVRAAKLCDKLVSVFVRESDVVDAINFLKKHQLPNVVVTDAYYFDRVIP